MTNGGILVELIFPRILTEMPMANRNPKEKETEDIRDTK